MINELYELSKAMEKSGFSAQSWHREYKPIPNIRANAPCIRIEVSDGRIVSLSSVSKELGTGLRKYGNNQGSYPCMNIAPLFRIRDDLIKTEISKIKPEKIDGKMIETIKGWCQESNWIPQFLGKYKISMVDTPKRMGLLLKNNPYLPLNIIMEETAKFADPSVLFRELERCAFELLESKTNVDLAMALLFFYVKNGKDKEYGSVSIVFDTPKLVETGTYVASNLFTKELNQALLSGTEKEESADELKTLDAFSVPFEPIEEPMPEAKLAGGFDVKLRTMFKEQRCQNRYGRIENASYPISPEIRKKLQAALIWIGGSLESKGVTWINLGKNEILFTYPDSMPKTPVSLTRMFKARSNTEKLFKEQAKQFLREINGFRDENADSRANRIHIFILRKIDKGRTKIVYTRQTNPKELEKCSEIWSKGCSDNLPEFLFGAPEIPFPLDASEILNRFWKQTGELATEQFKPTPQYHGMELLMEPDLQTSYDMHTLTQNGILLASHLGRLIAEEKYNVPIWDKVRPMLALMGLLLYRKKIKKENYMETYAYQYGQLLKVSDAIHLQYCNIVRGGDIPPQLAGGSLFQATTDAPTRTLVVLGQRMMPYLQWASTYQHKNVTEPGKESWRVKWLYQEYEEIVTKLGAVWTSEKRFSDEEKAMLFIGYLAKFPKKEQKNDAATNKEEEL